MTTRGPDRSSSPCFANSASSAAPLSTLIRLLGRASSWSSSSLTVWTLTKPRPTLVRALGVLVNVNQGMPCSAKRRYQKNRPISEMYVGGINLPTDARGWTRLSSHVAIHTPTTRKRSPLSTASWIYCMWTHLQALAVMACTKTRAAGSSS